MDKGCEKEGFEKLGIKISVAVKFRNFCKKTSKSQSMTLLLMMEFFERNEMSPEDDFKPGLIGFENRIKKRINALIAIIKDIEKNQTKPTMAMIQSLFAAVEPIKKPRMIAKSPEEFKAQFEKNKTEVKDKEIL